MNSIVLDFATRGIINLPNYIHPSALYEVLMGSHAFGADTPSSDRDIYGFFIPETLTLPDYSDDHDGRFRQINIIDVEGQTPCDIMLYPVSKFFQLCTRGYSQQLEVLFAPDSNLLTVCSAAKQVRDARHIFLHQGTVKEFRRFAHVQLEEMIHRRRTDGQRAQYIEQYGFDVKAAYHVVRLMGEAYQLHTQGDLTLQNNRELLLQIRNGKWTEQEIVSYVQFLASEIDNSNSQLPTQPDLDNIKQLFVDCADAAGAHIAFPASELFGNTH